MNKRIDKVNHIIIYIIYKVSELFLKNDDNSKYKVKKIKIKRS